MCRCMDVRDCPVIRPTAAYLRQTSHARGPNERGSQRPEPGRDARAWLNGHRHDGGDRCGMRGRRAPPHRSTVPGGQDSRQYPPAQDSAAPTKEGRSYSPSTSSSDATELTAAERQACRRNLCEPSQRVMMMARSGVPDNRLRQGCNRPPHAVGRAVRGLQPSCEAERGCRS